MQDTKINVVNNDDGTLSYSGAGYGEKCPACRRQLGPGERRRTMPGVWRPYHDDCYPVLSQEQIDAELAELL